MAPEYARLAALPADQLDQELAPRLAALRARSPELAAVLSAQLAARLAPPQATPAPTQPAADPEWLRGWAASVTDALAHLGREHALLRNDVARLRKDLGG